MSAFKMKKVPFTTNNSVKGNGRGRLTSYVLYVITDKKTGKYSKNIRADLIFNINPNLADLGNKLKFDGENMSKAELEHVVREHCQKQHEYINDKYVNHSRKRKILDEHGECLDVKGDNSLYYLEGNVAFEAEEYQRMKSFQLFSDKDSKLIKKLKGVKNRNSRAKIIKKHTKSKLDIDLIKKLDGIKDPEQKAEIIRNYITKDFIATYENKVKKQRKIEGRKTKSDDIETMLNAHVKNEKNPHVHFMCHSFCPITNRWLNPITFKHIKQLTHLEAEAKYSDFLTQGIAIGEFKNKGKLARTEYLAQCINKGQNWKEAKQSFKDIQSELDIAIKSNRPTAEIISNLKKKGIHISVNEPITSDKYSKKINQRMKIKIDDFDIDLNSESFNTKKVKGFDVNVKKFMERLTSDSMSKSMDESFKSDKIQTVLESVLESTKIKLERDLRNANPEDRKKIKQKAFKEFITRNLNSGLAVNLNKQGNLLFHKINENHYENKDGLTENNATAKKYKASMFQNPELQGKSLMELFELDEEAIKQHQIELFKLMPKSANYRDVVYFNAKLSEMNLVEKELRIKEQYSFTLKQFNLETKLDEKGNLFLFDKEGRALINKEYKSDGISSSISINSLHPKLASPILLSMLQEDARALTAGTSLIITPEIGETSFEVLRHLEVDLMFSTDANSQKIKVNYPHKNTDEKLAKMIDERLDKELQRFNKNVHTYSKGKTKFTFTEASGLHLLSNPNFIDQHEKIQAQFNNQIIDMISDRGITEIKFSSKDKSYFDRNEKELLDLAESLPEEKKQKVLHVIEAHKKEIKTETKKNINEIESKRIKSKRPCI